jgi:hypothetical protein
MEHWVTSMMIGINQVLLAPFCGLEPEFHGQREYIMIEPQKSWQGISFFEEYCTRPVGPKRV